MKIVQMLITPVIHVAVEEVGRLTHRSRGTGGFGSTRITANV
jgi:dUTP pyrophosphatase